MGASIDSPRPYNHGAADDASRFVFDEHGEADSQNGCFEITVDPPPAADDLANDAEGTVCSPLPSDLY
jgi:hypothetical protein